MAVFLGWVFLIGIKILDGKIGHILLERFQSELNNEEQVKRKIHFGQNVGEQYRQKKCFKKDNFWIGQKDRKYQNQKVKF